jgi:hypothetical protein
MIRKPDCTGTVNALPIVRYKAFGGTQVPKSRKKPLEDSWVPPLPISLKAWNCDTPPLDTSPSMVYRARQQLVEEGLDAVLSRKQRATPAVARIFDGEKRATASFRA